ncbi:hypothetical protein Dimus_009254 [Dionaea muscipula]
MATTSSIVSLTAAALVLAAMMICAAQAAVSPAPAPTGSDCSVVLQDATDCLPYISAIPSNQAKPSKQCCSELTSQAKGNHNAAFCFCHSGITVSYFVDSVGNLALACGLTQSNRVISDNDTLLCVAAEAEAEAEGPSSSMATVAGGGYSNSMALLAGIITCIVFIFKF